MRIAQIYRGIIDYGSDAGLPAVSIRLAGCELACSVEGTCAPSRTGGQELKIEEILHHVKTCGLRRVVICGGEPLIYPETADLVDALLEEDCTLYLETSFTEETDPLPDQVSRLIDIKCPSNGTCYQVNWRMAETITPNDNVLFVVADRNDYIWSRDVLRREQGLSAGNCFIIPRTGEVRGSALASWILNDGLDIRLQRPLNIHISEKDLLLEA